MKLIAWNRMKEGELVGMTLTELLLVFIFAFLLVLNVFYRDRQLALKTAENVPQIVQLIEEIAATFQDLDGPPTNAAPPKSDERVIVVLQQVKEKLEAVAGIAGFDRPDVWETVRRYQGVSNVVSMLENESREAGRLKKENDVLKQKLKDAGIALPRGPLGGEGDKPGNCWYSDPVLKRGDEFLLRVTIRERDLLIERSWPESRDEEVARLKQLDVLVNGLSYTTTREDFMEKAEPIFEYSKTKGCRYYVRVFDQAETKKGFQDGLRAVEERFYKLAENF